MTRKAGDAVLVEVQHPERCSRCGDVLGTGAPICFSCATEEERERYGARLFGES